MAENVRLFAAQSAEVCVNSHNCPETGKYVSLTYKDVDFPLA